MAKLKIFNYANEVFEIPDIELEDIKSIGVEVVAGDEILSVYLRNGDIRKIDSSEIAKDHRNRLLYHGCYSVDSEDFERWNEREDSYEWFPEGAGVYLEFPEVD